MGMGLQLMGHCTKTRQNSNAPIIYLIYDISGFAYKNRKHLYFNRHTSKKFI